MSDNTDHTTDSIDNNQMYQDVETTDLLDYIDIKYVQKLSELDGCEISTIFEPVCAVGGGTKDDEITLCSITPADADNSFTISKWKDGRYTQINNLEYDEYEELIEEIQEVLLIR